MPKLLFFTEFIKVYKMNMHFTTLINAVKTIKAVILNSPITAATRHLSLFVPLVFSLGNAINVQYNYAHCKWKTRFKVKRFRTLWHNNEMSGGVWIDITKHPQPNHLFANSENSDPKSHGSLHGLIFYYSTWPNLRTKMRTKLYTNGCSLKPDTRLSNYANNPPKCVWMFWSKAVELPASGIKGKVPASGLKGKVRASGLKGKVRGK